MNTLAPSPELMPELGKSSHYRLVRKIGQGGMSVVYEAFDERLKRAVAIKVLHPFLAEAPEYKTRFLREAEAVARLTHPNILQIYDISHDKPLYIVTELLMGNTLTEQARHINFIEMPELGAMIICQMAKALEHAHNRGIIHRDIKPENIIITNEGQLKLLDFGIASIGSDESLTQSGTLLGSLAHVAPEVIKGEQATAKSDIYALSTVFFWLLSGQLPFRADSPHALLKAIVDNPTQKIQKLSAYVSDSLALIIERGMHKDPQERFLSANELAFEIEQALIKMGLIFDLNKLTIILKNPTEELESFKSTLLKNIKNQAILYEQSGQHADALALECRLDAVVALKKPAKKSFKIYVIFGGISIGIFCLGFFIINTKSESKEPLILAKELESKLSESILPVVPVIPAMPETEVVLAPKEPQIHVETPKPIMQQELIITIWPFATIIIDGMTKAIDVKHQRIKLEPGLHRLKFTHTYAATVEKVINIKTAQEPFELNIIMNKTKPAFLVVNCEPEAYVAVNNIFKGSSAQSLKRPIVVSMPDKTHALSTEIIIQRDKYKPVIIPIKFIAGETQKINVTLVAE